MFYNPLIYFADDKVQEFSTDEFVHLPRFRQVSHSLPLWLENPQTKKNVVIFVPKVS